MLHSRSVFLHLLRGLEQIISCERRHLEKNGRVVAKKEEGWSKGSGLTLAEVGITGDDAILSRFVF